jgi:UDP-N-acetylmuramate: L-alanyl-gamma-D-glutamyl-meso-diaminopimelate ligase
LSIFTDAESFQNFLLSQNLENTALLFMSSGNYGGLDLTKISESIP